jgi:FMN-dependent NADH-azoreductase
MYSTSEGGRAMEHQESYLQTVFGFFGVTDVRIVRAEGLSMGDAGKAQALASAGTDILSATKQAANASSAKQAA